MKQNKAKMAIRAIRAMHKIEAHYKEMVDERRSKVDFYKFPIRETRVFLGTYLEMFAFKEGGIAAHADKMQHLVEPIKPAIIETARRLFETEQQLAAEDKELEAKGLAYFLNTPVRKPAQLLINYTGETNIARVRDKLVSQFGHGVLAPLNYYRGAMRKLYAHIVAQRQLVDKALEDVKDD